MFRIYLFKSLMKANNALDETFGFVRCPQNPKCCQSLICGCHRATMFSLLSRCHFTIIGSRYILGLHPRWWISREAVRRGGCKQKKNGGREKKNHKQHVIGIFFFFAFFPCCFFLWFKHYFFMGVFRDLWNITTKSIVKRFVGEMIMKFLVHLPILYQVYPSIGSYMVNSWWFMMVDIWFMDGYLMMVNTSFPHNPRHWWISQRSSGWNCGTSSATPSPAAPAATRCRPAGMRSPCGVAG